MRIISGERRGTKLEAVPGMNTRPTADRVKEGLFNVLQMDIDSETVVLDAFAGTGNLGLEALSRGAKRAVFIEKDAQALAVLRANIKKCRYEDRATVIKGDALGVLPTLAGERFDLIFLDPPYRKDLYEPVFFSILKYHFLSECGILVSEHAKSVPFSYEHNSLTCYKTKSYGDTVLNFFRMEP
ncbi:MAG: 16S rRNA (guanine(966)-N(2))-methyltransferase RsmD [Peptococcaceae bacterium]|nr:16S rRNA (guanine(966)-N(2))-methyltransferase RsmD [Peptococcaceae bacterium]